MVRFVCAILVLAKVAVADIGCFWETTSGLSNVLECMDGHLCNGATEGWGCCSSHNGRKRCPSNFPEMCEDITSDGDFACHRTCAEQDVPPRSCYTCDWKVGDGVSTTGTADKHVGSTVSRHACEILVKSTEITANGATWNPLNGACYAEYNMEGTNGSSAYEATEFGSCSHCRWTKGDGFSSQEILVGSGLTRDQCEAAVRRQQPSANGATWETTGEHKCFAEMAMTGVSGANTNTVWSTMFFYTCSGCKWKTGDSNGNEVFMGLAYSPTECADLVLAAGSSYNSATWNNDEGSGHQYKCFAEQGATTIAGTTTNVWISMFLNECIPSSATDAPTKHPTGHPTKHPTGHPTKHPTGHPTKHPTGHPTDSPTASPTGHPTNSPTVVPTNAPTATPTDAPTVSPTGSPTGSPTTEDFQAAQLANEALEAHPWTTGVIGDVAYKCHDFEGCYENTVAERSKFVVATTEVDKSQLDPETQHTTTDGSFIFSAGGIVFVSTDGLEEYHFPHDCQCSGVTQLASTVDEALEGYYSD